MLPILRCAPVGVLAAALSLLTPAQAAPPAAPGPVLGSGPSVVAVSPARNATDAPTAAVITATSDTALDPTTVDGDSVTVWGRWSGPMPGTVSLAPNGQVITFTPGRPFFPGETVTVQLTASIESVGGDPLIGGHAWMFSAGTAPGSGNFGLAGTMSTEHPGETFVQSYGIYAGDLDQDGAPDFAIPSEQTDDVRVMMNNGCASFSAPVSHDLGGNATPSSNEGADYNGDGHVDLATANIFGDSMSVLLGDGAGGFSTITTYPAGNGPRGLSILDAEGDGDTDIVTAHRISSDLALFRNDGSGTFAAAAFFEGGGTGETGVTCADADNDGFVDVFAACHTNDRVTVLLNDGAGNFIFSDSASTGPDPWNIATADVDLDGNIDVGTCNAGNATATIARGDGAGGLTVFNTLTTGPFGLAIDFGDLDGDGDMDVVTSNLGTSDWSLLKNDGSGNFGPTTSLPAAQSGSCATLVDYDRDGFLDIVGLDEFEDEVSLWRQSVPSPLGVASPRCQSTLRVDNLANRGGFGNQPAHPAVMGNPLFLGITADPGAAWTLTLGLPLEPGLPGNFGLLNIAPPILVLFGSTTNAQGEALVPAIVPPGSPVGLEIALQVFVEVPTGFRTTNPEVVEITN